MRSLQDNQKIKDKEEEIEVKLIAKTYPIEGESDMQVVERAVCVCYNSEPTPDFRIAKMV